MTFLGEDARIFGGGRNEWSLLEIASVAGHYSLLLY